MSAPDAPAENTFDSKFHLLIDSIVVRGATWVEYWLQLDNAPDFSAHAFAPGAQIQSETRCVGGAPVAARALWEWGLAAQLETAFGDDANGRFARRTVENDLQEIAAQTENFALQLDSLQLKNLSERTQPYRVHLCASQNEMQKYEMQKRALLQHGFCDETLQIQWQQNDDNRRVEWREEHLWLDDERWNLQSAALRNVAGGVQVLAAALCRVVMENRSWDEVEIAACKYLQR